MSAAKSLPFHVGCAARLHMRGGEHGFAIVVAATEAEAVPEAASRPGAVAALLTHDAGISWPDRKGEAVARSIIAAGGAVVLAFASLADALACLQRVRGKK
jgi:hypothetical protein